MTTYRFQEVRAYRQQAGKCPVCGKRAVRKYSDFMTISPFNVWNSNSPCSCWHEEVRTISRLRQDPGPDPNERAEAVELPCDQDVNEAS